MQYAMPFAFDDHSSPSTASVGATSPETVEAGGLAYRAFDTPEDAAACVALQSEIWGAAFADQVPASLLRVATSIGGLAIGAFDRDGALVGFVFSLAGVRNGEPIHWSHMLAVRESARGAGVGRHLKEMQRAELARRGIARVLWTFDPLQARNAHLNVNRLGVRVIDYVENMYGITGSPLHHGLATDRLVVMLPTSPTAAARPAPPAAMNGGVPVLTPFPRAGDLTIDLDDTAAPVVMIEIPSDLQRVVAATPPVAATWRLATRGSFLRALRGGYQVVALRRDLATDRAFYVLVASERP
ncbi:MAG TPA: GNAT family N-acetyltransferase [Gemmatimonadaceae bacterium]|jgi:predicted GNAT superfamily acetyltransferase|nr:GNAT family N-acetyltransferase [Gemmatimonadaceae bacterium]